VQQRYTKCFLKTQFLFPNAKLFINTGFFVVVFCFFIILPISVEDVSTKNVFLQLEVDPIILAHSSCLCGTGIRTQNAALGRQVFYCLSHFSSPFFSGYF
jgi:hypothetical protein